jgi:hypothetical protein
MEQLKSKAKQLGLWNLFLPSHFLYGPDADLYQTYRQNMLSNYEYAYFCIELGKSPHVAPEVKNEWTLRTWI